ncbi:MAG: TM2 domain-containing protein [Pseudomonadota bacterium]
MRKAWKELDLEGGGLQSLNARLAREMRRRPVAYGAWILFPLGLHRFYLREPFGGGLYVLLTAAALALLVWGPAWWWAAPVAALAIGGVADLIWIDRRVTGYNKELRKRLFLRKGHRPPQDYRGRYTSDADAERELDDYRAIKERERAGHPGAVAADDGEQDTHGRRQAPSFNEQEAMLRQMRRGNTDRDR